MKLVSVREVSYRFAGGEMGLCGVDFDIHSDEFLLVTGPNGAGKTLLMLHIVGLIEPVSGEVRYRDKPIGAQIDEVRRRVGIVFQNPESQFLGQTVTEDVGFGLEFSGFEPDEIERRTENALHRMSISELAGRRPIQLSGGEQRKAAIAALLAREPEVLILDEPFIGLDLAGVCSTLSALDRLRSDGHTIVVITHDVEKVLAHCDRVVVMNAGRIADSGIPADIAPKFDAYGVRCPGMSVSVMSWLYD